MATAGGRDDSVFTEVANLIDEVGFGWILEEVRETIREGKPTSKQVLPRKQGADGNVYAPAVYDFQNKRSSKREERASTEPYTEQEQLQILIDATKEAIRVTQETRSSVAVFLKEADLTDLLISFGDPVEAVQVDSVNVGEAEPDSVDAFLRLSALLEQTLGAT